MSLSRPILKHLALAAFAVDAAVGVSVMLIGPALAQPAPAFPPFPQVRSLPAIATWVRKNSDLPLATVVGVGSDSIFAVQRSPQAPPMGVRAIIRQEAITPDFAKRLGGRSASMLVDIDCEGRRVFQRQVDLYTGSNRQGPSRQLGAAKDWQAIPAGTFMERVMVAICDPAYRAPYAGGLAPSPALATSPPPPASPAPASAPYYAEIPPSSPPPLPSTPYPRAAPPVASSRGARVELGRYDSVAAALSFWNAAGLADSGKRLRLELSTAGGATRYRAVVEGFSGHAEADAFCRMIVVNLGGQCILVD